jgi:hypothetical protein
VCLGRLANIIFRDANTALVTISIVFSCGTAAMIYVLADHWFGRRAALPKARRMVFEKTGERVPDVKPPRPLQS